LAPTPPSATPSTRDRVLDDDTVANDVNLMRNGSPTAPSASVDDGDELAMFPPVTGGQ